MDLADHRTPQQVQVAQHIQHLVPRKLVGQCRGLGDAVPVDDPAVLFGPGFQLTRGKCRVQLLFEREGPGRRQQSGKPIRIHAELRGLAPDHGVIVLQVEAERGHISRSRFNPALIYADPQLLRDHHRLYAPPQLLRACLAHQRVPEGRASVEKRDLRPVKLDSQVRDPVDMEHRHEVFHEQRGVLRTRAHRRAGRQVQCIVQVQWVLDAQVTSPDCQAVSESRGL